MHAAVDHVHHRHRERRRLLAAEVPEEGNAGLVRRRLRVRQRDAEDRVRAEPALVVGSVELDEHPVEAVLVGRVAAAGGCSDLTLDVRHRPGHALAAVRVAAVPQLDGLVDTGGGTRGHRRAAERTRLEPDVDLDGRVPARVEDLAGMDVLDRAHCISLARSK